MPRIKRNIAFALARDFKAFLRLGVGRGIAPEPGEEQLRSAMRRLRREKNKRRRAESRLRQLGDRANVPAGAERAHALPEPGPSINKQQLFHSLISLLKPGRMLDLGSGRGNFSVLAAQLDWEVTAVDARTVR